RAEQARHLARLSEILSCRRHDAKRTLRGEWRCTGQEVVMRKRQANVAGGRPVRREVKLTDAEDAAIRFAASELSITVPRYLKESALAASRGETATERANLLKQ